jgi:hypothetical protein
MRYFLPFRRATLACAFAVLLASRLTAQEAPVIKHSFLATGGQTRIIDGEGQTIWQFPASTRDGQVLPNGNIVLAASKSNEFPNGAVLEVTRDGKRVFEWKGTQAEINTAQLLANGNFLVSEAGARPRILEVNREGQIKVEVPLQCQTHNHHMQSRMTRKLGNGNYLVPQLFDKVVREYTPEGKIVWEWKAPDEPKDSWPFTAIRLPNGNTLINLTHGNLVYEVDAAGKTVWQLSNADLPGNLLNDPCGAQRLPNGNTVICSYAIGANRTKLLEVTPDKKVVWTFAEATGPGIHEVHILDTNGVAVPGTPLR